MNIASANYKTSNNEINRFKKNIHVNKKVLMKKKVKFDECIVLIDLIKDNDVDSVKKLLNSTIKSNNKININKLNDSGLTILHLAVLENSIELIKLLLDYGANINMRDRDSWSVLHASASMGFYEVSRFLIDNGADVHMLTCDNYKPIDLIDDDNEKMKILFNNYMKLHDFNRSNTKKK